MLDVRVLGGLGAAVDGVPIELPADARARELLAWLALNPGLYARSAVAGRLRPDVPEESARKTLRDAVYELRRSLGPDARDAVVATRDRVGLRDEGVRVDVREFRDLRAAGRPADAVEAGRGELLPGLDADWVLRARGEHLADWTDTLGSLAAAAEGEGDLAAAVEWARRRVDADPLAERANLELVRLLALAGDRPAALGAASAFSERLRRELGLPASPATRALVAEVRAGRLGGGSPPASAEGGHDHPLPGPLARTAEPEGREPALARLEAAWDDAAAGTLRVALVTGEPGIGKTTLAGELARRVRARGAVVLYGRSDEQLLVPYQPWVEAVDGLLAALPPAEADRWLTAHDGALARLLPGRAPGAAVSGDGAHERYLAFETVRALLDRTARATPLLLVLDDVHWADPDALQLLRHLVRTTFNARILIVLCAREREMSEDAAATLAALRREGPVAGVPLAGLDEAALAALVARRLGAADPEAVHAYGARSGGNPFFLEELLRHAGEGAADAPPASVREVVAGRLLRLDPRTRAALARAAVIGREFDLATLAGAAGMAAGDVLAALDGATEAGLLVPVGSRGRFAFAHALVQEAIVAGLPASEAARLHLELAERLAGRPGEALPAAEVVRHLRAAGPLADAGRAARWELAAAVEATSALAHEEAVAHYEAALAGLPGGRERAEALVGLGRARDRAGRREAARAAFAEAAAVARRDGDADLLARAALGHGGLAVVIAGADPEVTALLDEALAALPPAERARGAILRARLAVELYYADPARSRELSARAVEDARAADDPSALAAALNARRVALWDPDHIAERRAAADAMVAAAERAGDREAALQGRNWRVVDLLESGLIGDAVSEIDAYETLADAVGLPHYRWYVHLWRAGLAIMAGRWDEADALGRRAQEVGERAADPNAPLLVRVQRQCALDRRFRTAEQEREWLAEMAASSPVPGPWLSSVALIDAAAGRREAARAMIGRLVRDDCAAMPMNANWHASCELSEAVADVGDRDAAATLYRRLLPHAGLFAVVARGVSCYSVTEHHLGRLALTLGRADEAEQRLARAAAAHDAVGARPHSAVTRLRLAEALEARGDTGPARAMRAEVAARAHELDMPLLAAAASAPGG